MYVMYRVAEITSGSPGGTGGNSITGWMVSGRRSSDRHYRHGYAGCLACYAPSLPGFVSASLVSSRKRYYLVFEISLLSCRESNDPKPSTMDAHRWRSCVATPACICVCHRQCPHERGGSPQRKRGRSGPWPAWRIRCPRRSRRVLIPTRRDARCIRRQRQRVRAQPRRRRSGCR